jgi:hypothetical protein
MLLAIAVPSILEAIIAELQNRRREEEAAGGFKKDGSEDQVDEDTMFPRTPRAEGRLKGKEDEEKMRRRKLTAGA